MSKKYLLKIIGMHCASCELWVEDSLAQIPGIIKVDAKLNSNELALEIDETVELSRIVEMINSKINPRKYEVILKKTNIELVSGDNPSDLNIKNTTKLESWLNSIIIALIVVGIFVIIQNLPFVNSLNQSSNFLLIFLIGLVASISTCGATVGSLILGLSASTEKNSKNRKSIYSFHFSRLISFVLLGGLLAILGKSFELSPTFLYILRIFIQLVLIFLGLNLLGVKLFDKFLPRLPKILSKKSFSISRSTAWFAPILLGFLTFFLPCGFTQSMQLQALESGSILTGAMIMGVFALGTLPVLLGITQISEKMSNQNSKNNFFRTAGLIVLAFAIWELWILGKVYFGLYI